MLKLNARWIELQRLGQVPSSRRRKPRAPTHDPFWETDRPGTALKTFLQPDRHNKDMEDYNSTDILAQTFAYAQKEAASLDPERDANTIRRLSKTVAEVANRTLSTTDYASPPEIQALRSKCYFASKRQRKPNGIANLRVSASICCASSRVGARISAYGPRWRVSSVSGGKLRM